MTNLLKVITQNTCSKCFIGKVFKSPYKMNKACHHCGHIFEKESGYFTGAMYLSYLLGAFTCLPVVLVMLLVLNLDLWLIVTAVTIIILFLNPLYQYLSRQLWMYFDLNGLKS